MCGIPKGFPECEIPQQLRNPRRGFPEYGSVKGFP